MLREAHLSEVSLFDSHIFGKHSRIVQCLGSAPEWVQDGVRVRIRVQVTDRVQTGVRARARARGIARARLCAQISAM